MERRKTSVRERRKEKEKRGDRCVMRVELPESFEKRMQEMLGDEYESYIERYDNPRQ